MHVAARSEMLRPRVDVVGGSANVKEAIENGSTMYHYHRVGWMLTVGRGCESKWSEECGKEVESRVKEGWTH